MSIDYRLMIAYFVTTMAMMMAVATREAFLTVGLECLIAAFVAGAAFIVALVVRRRMGWRCPAINAQKIIKMLATLAMFGLFIFVALKGLGPLKAENLPWALGAVGLGVFQLLRGLGLASMSKAEFASACGKSAPAPVSPSLPAWKRTLRAIYTILFLCVWLEMLAFFYFSSESIQQGAALPTLEKTERTTEHGHVVFISLEEKRRNDLLMMGGAIGVPTMIVMGLILQGLGVVTMFAKPWGDRKP